MSLSKNSLFPKAKSELEKPSVLSFDVFGTLITRLQLRPKDRFFSAYRRLGLEAAELNQLVEIREHGEARAARRMGPDLYSIGDIYQEMSGLDNFAVCYQDRALLAELEMEKEQCFAIQKGKNLWEEAKSSSKIIYVSDMYLPAKFIRELLEQNGLWEPQARLFVSHLEGCAKHSGLFSKIHKELGLRPENIAHTGDSFKADVKTPHKIGLRTFLFKGAMPTRYEKTLHLQSSYAMADAIRFGRLRVREQQAEQADAAWETACGVIAPLFISYVMWVAAYAKEKGLRRLYFISRDGLIFKEIYDLLRQGCSDWPESRYLYGSRHAWSCIRAAELKDKDIDFFLFEKAHVTARQVLRRIGFSADEISRLDLPEEPKRNLDQVATVSDLKNLKELLLTKSFSKTVRNHGQLRVARAKAYLTQEGLQDGVPFGLVDLGWGGNLQNYLDRILAPAVIPCGFYLQLIQATELKKAGRAFGWLADLPFIGLDGAAARAMLENFCCSDHGMTLGYRLHAKVWKPVFANTEKDGPERTISRIQHQAVGICAQAFVRLVDPPLESKKNQLLQLAAVRNFKKFLLTPSQEEAETYGAIRVTSRQEGGKAELFAPDFSLREVITAFCTGFGRMDAFWPAGSICRSRGWAKGFLALRILLAQAKAAVFETFG